MSDEHRATYPDVKQMPHLLPEQMHVRISQDGSAVIVGAWEHRGTVWYEKYDAVTGRHIPSVHRAGDRL